MDEEAIFLEALQKSSADARTAFVRAACAGHDALRQGVESLLRAHDAAGKFLQDQPPGILPTIAQPAIVGPRAQTCGSGTRGPVRR